MTVAIRSQRPFNPKSKMANARIQTGYDIRDFNVYCSNSSCRSVTGSGETVPQMNYHGTKLALSPARRRTHVFVCSICNCEKHYRRKWFGSEWYRIR